MLLEEPNFSKSDNNLINIINLPKKINNNLIKEEKENNKYSKCQSNDDLTINISKKCSKIRGYQIIKELGEGAFGSVYLVQKENTNDLYALKVLNKEFLTKTEKTEEPIIERNILVLCNHPSIIKLISTFQSKHKLYFVLEYAENKDLNNLLQKMQFLSNNTAQQIIAELVNVIEYLHIKMNISHNDLKPGNIMLDQNYHIKLIDFSTAKIHGKIFDKSIGKFINSDNFVSKEILGTIEYMSPEMLNHTIEDYRTNDIWALGVIIYIIYNGKNPFKGKNDYLTSNNIKSGNFSFKDNNTPEEVKDLINNIFVLDTHKRYNIEQIKKHNYFKDINWDNLLNNNIIIDENLFNKKDENNNAYWDNFFSQIEKVNNIENVNINNKQEFKINKYQKNFEDIIINNFYYIKYNSYNEEKQYSSIIKDKIIYEGILIKMGFIEKEVKLIIYNDFIIDVINIENNNLIKQIKLNKNMNIKVEKQTELTIENDKFKSSKKEINKWYNLITDIYFCKE